MTTTPAGDPRALRALRRLAADGPLVVAHRGESAAFPENTLPAFAAAMAGGAPVVELDVRTTRDGALVCVHDDVLDRTSDASSALGRTGVGVEALALDEIRRLDAGAWKDRAFAGVRIPTLHEALAAIAGQGAIALVEHKRAQPEAILAALAEHDLTETAVVQSFDWPWLAAIHAAAPNVALGALSEEPFSADVLPRLALTGARFAHWRDRALGLPDIAALRDRGYLVGVWTVDAEIAWAGAARAGIELITTNRACHAVATRARWTACPLP